MLKFLMQYLPIFMTGVLTILVWGVWRLGKDLRKLSERVRALFGSGGSQGAVPGASVLPASEVDDERTGTHDTSPLAKKRFRLRHLVVAGLMGVCGFLIYSAFSTLDHERGTGKPQSEMSTSVEATVGTGFSCRDSCEVVPEPGMQPEYSRVSGFNQWTHAECRGESPDCRTRCVIDCDQCIAPVKKPDWRCIPK